MRAVRGPQMDKARSGQLEEVMRYELTPRYLAAGPASGRILELCIEMALSLGPDVFGRQSAALRDRPDRQETLRALDIPALILCGRHDVLSPVECHELMHGLMPHARFMIIEGAAHLPTLEAPDATNSALESWLGDI